MKFSDESYGLRVELDTENFDVSPAQAEKMEKGLDPLRRPVRAFPVSDLYVTIVYHPRSRDYRVKTALVLSGRTLATGDLDQNMYQAFERCIRKLVKKVDAYKSSLAAADEQSKHRKGTHHDVLPSREPDAAALEQAVSAGNYAEFRRATYVYEESVRSRVGRWIDRYPQVAARLNDDISVDDVIEEVFLNAFERFDARPDKVRFGDWLEHLIDPSIKLLAKTPDQELENIRFVRSTWETETGAE